MALVFSPIAAARWMIHRFSGSSETATQDRDKSKNIENTPIRIPVSVPPESTSPTKRTCSIETSAPKSISIASRSVAADILKTDKSPARLDEQLSRFDTQLMSLSTIQPSLHAQVLIQLESNLESLSTSEGFNSPDLKERYKALGDRYYRACEFERALKTYSKAIDLFQECTFALQDLLQFYSKLGLSLQRTDLVINKLSHLARTHSSNQPLAASIEKTKELVQARRDRIQRFKKDIDSDNKATFGFTPAEWSAIMCFSDALANTADLSYENLLLIEDFILYCTDNSRINLLARKSLGKFYESDSIHIVLKIAMNFSYKTRSNYLQDIVIAIDTLENALELRSAQKELEKWQQLSEFADDPAKLVQHILPNDCIDIKTYLNNLSSFRSIILTKIAQLNSRISHLEENAQKFPRVTSKSKVSPETVKIIFSQQKQTYSYRTSHLYSEIIPSRFSLWN